MESKLRGKGGLEVTVIRHSQKKTRLTTGQRLFLIVGTLMVFCLIAVGLMFF